jgi:very-short-patch-repair endonuclease
VQVSVPEHLRRRSTGIVVHRRRAFQATLHHGIPVTPPIATLTDLAAVLPASRVEVAINEADKLDLVDSEELRAALDQARRRPGIGVLRNLLDRQTFTITDSELERRFLRLVPDTGLELPHTGQTVNGFKVDFFWPDLGLVVETDGLRYHRTAAQQARDRLRDQAHAAAGLTTLRFTRAQVRYDPRHVQSTLAAVGRRLQAARN